MDWIGTALILIGLWLIGSKKRIGFLFNAAGSALWVIFGVSHAIPSIIVLNALFILVHTRAWRNWGDKPEPHQQPETSWRKSLKYILPLAALILLFLFVPPTRAPFVDWFKPIFKYGATAGPVRQALWIVKFLVWFTGIYFVTYGIVWGRYRFQLEYISREVNNIMLMMRDSDDDSLMRRAISMIPRVQNLQAYKTPGLSPVSWLAAPKRWYYPWTWKWATEPNQYRETLIGIIEDAACATEEIVRIDNAGKECRDTENKRFLENLNLKGAYMAEAEFRRGGYFAFADLTGANLLGASINDGIFMGSTLANANLQEANLQGSYFGRSFLGGANLKKTFLDKACFSYAILTKACLENACLRSVDFEGAFLQGANLTGADLEGADFRLNNAWGEMNLKNSNWWMAKLTKNQKTFFEKRFPCADQIENFKTTWKGHWRGSNLDLLQCPSREWFNHDYPDYDVDDPFRV